MKNLLFLLLILPLTSCTDQKLGWFILSPNNIEGLTNLKFLLSGLSTTIYISIVSILISIIIGFIGVLIIIKPGTDLFQLKSLLPIGSAFFMAAVYLDRLTSRAELSWAGVLPGNGPPVHSVCRPCSAVQFYGSPGGVPSSPGDFGPLT